MDADRRMAQLASTQHGLAGRDQLLARGMTPAMVKSRLSAGRLELVHRGVYRVGGAPRSAAQAGLAACLAIGGTVAVSHRGAARPWGVDLPEEPPVEVSVATTRSVRLPRVVVHRSIDLSPSCVVRRDGVPVTDPMRLLVDLGAVVAPWVVEAALDHLVGRKVVSVAGVQATLDDLAARGRSGCGVLRDILDRRSGVGMTMSQSQLEARFMQLCRRSGLPTPQFQYPVVGGRRRRIDFAFPARRVAIEVDGYEFHSRHQVFEDDRVRANALELAGWTVLRFTWTQITSRPEYVVGVVRALLDQRAA